MDKRWYPQSRGTEDERSFVDDARARCPLQPKSLLSTANAASERRTGPLRCRHPGPHLVTHTKETPTMMYQEEWCHKELLNSTSQERRALGDLGFEIAPKAKVLQCAGVGESRFTPGYASFLRTVPRVGVIRQGRVNPMQLAGLDGPLAELISPCTDPARLDASQDRRFRQPRGGRSEPARAVSVARTAPFQRRG